MIELNSNFTEDSISKAVNSVNCFLKFYFDRSEVLSALRVIKNKCGGSELGICGNLNDLARSINHCGESIVGEISQHWQYFSGDKSFPVWTGSTDVNCTPIREWVFCVDMYDEKTLYGRLRFNLIDFMIAVFEEVIKHES